MIIQYYIISIIKDWFIENRNIFLVFKDFFIKNKQREKFVND